MIVALVIWRRVEEKSRLKVNSSGEGCEARMFWTSELLTGPLCKVDLLCGSLKLQSLQWRAKLHVWGWRLTSACIILMVLNCLLGTSRRRSRLFTSVAWTTVTVEWASCPIEEQEVRDALIEGDVHLRPPALRVLLDTVVRFRITEAV